jgi:hypothetical protein
MRNATSMVAIVVVASLGMWSCNACPGGPRPVLAFTQSWPNLSSAANPNLADRLNNGSITLNDPSLDATLRADQCVFFADFTATAAPRLVGSGTPGDPGFNVEIFSANLHRSGGSCPSPSPTELTIQPTAGISLGQTTHTGNATFVIGGDTFSARSGFFEFTLTRYDTSQRWATGNFQFVADNITNQQDTRTFVVLGGSFGLPIH